MNARSIRILQSGTTAATNALRPALSTRVVGDASRVVERRERLGTRSNYGKPSLGRDRYPRYVLLLQDQPVALLGVTVTKAPLQSVRLRFQPGVSVLYGVNGAGKSTLLRGLRSALRGIAEPGFQVTLHAHVLPFDEIDVEFDGQDRSLIGQLVRSLGPISPRPEPRTGVRESRLTWSMPVGSAALERRMSDRLLQRWEHLRPQLLIPLPTDLGHLADAPIEERVSVEIARQRLFNLRPTGTSEAEWEVWIGARADESAPRFRRQVAELHELMREVFAAEEAAEAIREDRPSDEEANSAWEAWNDLQIARDSFPLPVEVRSWVDDAFMTADDAERGHPWAALSVANCGVQRIEQPLRVLDDDAADLEKATLGSIRNRFTPLLVSLADQSPYFSEDVTQELGRVSRQASDVAALLLLDSPELRCTPMPATSWPDGGFVRWEAFDWPSGTWVPLRHLSQAQHRWATVSIRAAIGEGDAGGVLVIDEPEAALHPRAERYLLNGLASLKMDHRIDVIAASHSAELLNRTDFRLHHVRRAAQFTEVVELEGLDAGELDAMGLDRADLLQSYRVFLVVEGRHDEMVLRAFAEDELQQRRVLVLPMRGIRELRSIPEARLLLDFTTASIVIATDNVDSRVVIPMWEEAVNIADSGDIRGAIAHVHTILRRGSGEMQRVREFCVRSLELGEWPRMFTFGFKERDIVEYLDHKVVVPQSKSWISLRKQHASSGGNREFKEWLHKERGGNFDDDTLRKAARRLRVLPDDVIQLLDLCDAAGRRVGGGAGRGAR